MASRSSPLQSRSLQTLLATPGEALNFLRCFFSYEGGRHLRQGARTAVVPAEHGGGGADSATLGPHHSGSAALLELLSAQKRAPISVRADGLRVAPPR